MTLMHPALIRPATADEARRWFGAWRQRIDDWYAAHGAPGMGSNRHAAWESEPGEVYTLVDESAPDDKVVGFLALAIREGNASITDIWVEPWRRGRGYGRAARAFADQWAAARVRRTVAVLTTDDPAALALVRDLPLRAQKMVKKLGPPPELPPGLVARPMTEAEYGPWRANEVLAYAADISGSGILDAEAARADAERSYDELLPQGLASPGYTWWTIEAHGVPVATIWLAEHAYPRMSFVYSVETRPEYRGRGHGRAAMLVGERATLDAGDTHLGLNVFGHNTIAMRLYDSLGYVVVDQARMS